jgi:hypothetical protein
MYYFARPHSHAGCDLERRRGRALGALFGFAHNAKHVQTNRDCLWWYGMVGKKVIGVDPASGKKSYVFSPELRIDSALNVAQLHGHIQQWSTDRVLLCWDAPLTGPSNPNHPNESANLTRRPIEETHANSTKDVEGVSVLGYSGLSHWTITRHLLGLPIVSRFDAPFDQLPLYPVFDRSSVDKHSAVVTEVHPTLALWYWLQNESLFPYKKSSMKADERRAKVHDAWATLLQALEPFHLEIADFGPPSSDDELDARLAWILGTLWLKDEAVHLEGDVKTGSFLLPRSSPRQAI